MYDNYDGSSVGQKNAQFGALDELYRVWNGATRSKDDGSMPSVKRDSRLPMLTIAIASLALVAVVVMLGWALL